MTEIPTYFGRFNDDGKKTLELALREALSCGHNYIGPGHILLALITQGEVPEELNATELRHVTKRHMAKRKPTLEERVQALEDKLSD